MKYSNTPKARTFFHGGYFEESGFDKLVRFLMTVALPIAGALAILFCGYMAFNS